MKDYALSIVGKAVSAIAQMFMIILLANRLLADEVAIVLAIFSLASIVAALGDLGLGTLATRERAYGDLRKSDLAIVIADRLAVMFSIAGMFVMIMFARKNPSVLMCLPLLVWAPAERTTETRLLRLVAENRVPEVAMYTGARRAGALLLFVWWSSWMHSGLAFTSALAISALFVQRLVARRVPVRTRGTTNGARELLAEALPFTFTSISGQLRNLDVPLVTGLIGGPSAAAYGLGSRMASPFMLTFSSASSIVLTRSKSYSRRHLKLLLSCLMGAVFTISVSIIVLAPLLHSLLTLVIPWLTLGSTRVIAVVSSGYIMAGSAIILGSLCVAYGLELSLMRVNILTICSSLSVVTILGFFTGSALLAASGPLICYAIQACILVYLIWTRAEGIHNLEG